MRRTTKLFAVLLALALVAAACGSDDTAPTTAAPTATDAPTTTDAMMDFEPMSMEAPNCDYGGRIAAIEAVDELTVQFTLCSPQPAFQQIAAFTPFGIQPSEHLEATGGAPLDNP
ncbi:MAG: hypothetical protein HKN07_04520, partial [Acidimicrobiia bacterium]|nr:hypothetical protein [Acidimicrobiia bacterium]